MLKVYKTIQEGIYLGMDTTTYERSIDIDLAKGLGLYMILNWGRVALIQGIPVALSYNFVLIVACAFLLVMYYLYIFFVKYKCIPKVNPGAVITVGFVLITLALTLIMWPNNIQYMDPIEYIIFYEIFPFIILSMIRCIGFLYEPMVKASRILVVLCAVSSISIVVHGHTTVSTWSTYSMPLSYATLYAVMWLMCDFFNKRRITTLVLLVIGVLILVIFGARNPLLSVAAYIILRIIMGKDNSPWLKTLLLSSLVLLVLFFDPFLNSLNTFAQSYGIRSRTLTLFTEQRYFADSRTTIHQNIFDLIDNHPLGVGIAGDVAQTQEFAHGLYVSILCTYGYIIGALVILMLLGILQKAYKKSSGYNRDILIVYILAVLPRGFTGGDVWSSDVFWWMLGIAIAIIYGCHTKNDIKYG